MKSCGKFGLSFACCWLLNPAFAAILQIQITPKFSGEDIQPASLRYQTAAGETFSITRCSFLVSDFALQRSDGSWLEISNSVGWFDLEQSRDSVRFDNIQSGEFRFRSEERRVGKEG